MNITLDPEVKQRIQELSDRLDLTASRLIEEVMRGFAEDCKDDPSLGARVKRAVENRKRSSGETRDREEQIERILREFDRGQ